MPEKGTVTVRPGTWCCLGVASQVAIEHGLQITTALSRGSEVFDDFYAEFLCPQVQEWYGFASKNPVLLREDGTPVFAASWNDRGQDGEGPEADFTLIAAAFRRTYLDPASPLASGVNVERVTWLVEALESGEYAKGTRYLHFMTTPAVSWT